MCMCVKLLYKLEVPLIAKEQHKSKFLIYHPCYMSLQLSIRYLSTQHTALSSAFANISFPFLICPASVFLNAFQILYKSHAWQHPLHGSLCSLSQFRLSRLQLMPSKMSFLGLCLNALHKCFL